MRQGQNGKRSRGNRRNNNNSNRTVDSNGPEVKIRGSASHIYEKYQSLARDANIAGERIASENYLQHAEHYYRVMTAAAATAAANNPQSGRSESSGDGEQRRDNRSRPAPKQAVDNKPSETVSADTVTENEPAGEGAAEALPGLPPAAPQQPARRRRTRSRRPAEGRAADEKAEVASPEAKPEVDKMAEPKPVEVVEAPAAADEA